MMRLPELRWSGGGQVPGETLLYGCLEGNASAHPVGGTTRALGCPEGGNACVTTCASTSSALRNAYRLAIDALYLLLVEGPRYIVAVEAHGACVCPAPHVLDVCFRKRSRQQIAAAAVAAGVKPCRASEAAPDAGVRLTCRKWRVRGFEHRKKRKVCSNHCMNNPGIAGRVKWPQ